MKFFHRPVQDFEGITRNFEQLEGIFNSPPNQAFSFLQLLSAGNVHVAYGSATIPASGTPSATLTVTHGLPQTPVAVLATLDNSSFCELVFPGSVGATTFVLNANKVSGVNVTATSTVYWLAIG